MPITTPERLTFLDLDIPLLSTATSAQPEKKTFGSPTSDGTPGEGVYEVVVPFPPEGQLLPSFAQKEYDAGESLPSRRLHLSACYRQGEGLTLLHPAAGVSVVWSLELEGTRKGWYRQNDKCVPSSSMLVQHIQRADRSSLARRLSLDLPIVFPLPSSGPSSQATLTKQLKFEGNEPGGLSTEATVRPSAVSGSFFRS